MRILIILCLLVASGCVPSETLESQISGKWWMDTVQEGETDVSGEHNPEGNRWIEFGQDGQYESDGDPYGPNEGKWSVDETSGELYLDSDAGEGDDSYWLVTMSEEKMFWKGRRSDFTERFQLSYGRDPR